jgi:hypothetical protein
MIHRPRVLAVAVLIVLAMAPVARADFPYLPKSGGDPHNPLTWRLAPGEAPSNFGDDWKLAATPEQSAASDTLVNPKPEELCGVRGASVVDSNASFPALTGSCIPAGTPVRTAFEETLGRPDVVVAVLDSGIEWNNPGAMVALRDKVWLNQGELPAPRHDLSVSLVPGVTCASYRKATGGDYNRHGDYDVNDDGVFNVRDYACDSRVAAVVNGGSPRHALRHGPPGVLTPEDLILAFTEAATTTTTDSPTTSPDGTSSTTTTTRSTTSSTAMGRARLRTRMARRTPARSSEPVPTAW